MSFFTLPLRLIDDTKIMPALFDTVSHLLNDPPVRAQQWCDARPCIDLGGVVWTEPLGTALIYGLALFWIVTGVRLWQVRAAHRSRRWWACALVLGGIAAASAGTSFQAFGYELKCAGREFCALTNGWEIVFMTLQNASVNAMVMAVAYSSASGRLRRGMVRYALVNTVLHLLATIYGTLTANAFLISFEFLLLFSTPGSLFLIALNGRRYLRARTPVDGVLFRAWLGLYAVNGIYYAYLLAGLTQLFWQGGQGFYFSENDVLHVGMFLWVAYIYRVVTPAVVDLKAIPCA